MQGRLFKEPNRGQSRSQSRVSQPASQSASLSVSQPEKGSNLNALLRRRSLPRYLGGLGGPLLFELHFHARLPVTHHTSHVTRHTPPRTHAFFNGQCWVS